MRREEEEEEEQKLKNFSSLCDISNKEEIEE